MNFKEQALKAIHDIGGCDAADEWSRGYDAGVNAAYAAVAKLQLEKVIANITAPVDDVTEQAFREGFIKGKSEDSRIIRIANHYGYPLQSDIMIEECGELIQAICKLRRAWSDDRLANVKEELADVLIMARQLRVMLGAEIIDRIISSKLDRQLDRIREEEGDINECFRENGCK